MYSLRSHCIPRYPIRQRALGSILKPFQGFQCLRRLSVNILKRGWCFCVCNSCFILFVNSSMFLVYFTEVLRPVVYILILCMYIWIWMNSVLEDDHLGEIKLEDSKWNLRSRCLGTDRLFYFFLLCPISFLFHPVTSVLQGDDQLLLLVLHQHVSHTQKRENWVFLWILNQLHYLCNTTDAHSV